MPKANAPAPVIANASVNRVFGKVFCPRKAKRMAAAVKPTAANRSAANENACSLFVLQVQPATANRSEGAVQTNSLGTVKPIAIHAAQTGPPRSVPAIRDQLSMAQRMGQGSPGSSPLPPPESGP